MALLKLCTLILFYFLARASFAGACENFSDAYGKYKLCWDDKLQAWLSESCMNKSCEAKDLMLDSSLKFERKSMKNSRNPTSETCKYLEANVLILRDKRKNEQSFCLMKDSSVVDASAVERKIF